MLYFLNILLVLGFLFNGSEPEAITKALHTISSNALLLEQLQHHQIVLGAYGNRLASIPDNWSISDTTTPQPSRSDLSPQQYYHDYIKIWISQYHVKMVGGCCGISPQHISYIHEQINTNSIEPH